MLELLQRRNDEGLTLVVVTHDPKVARRADRIIVLLDGRIVMRVESSRIAEVMEVLSAADQDDEEDED